MTKASMLTIVWSAAAATALAQTPAPSPSPMPDDFQTGEVSLGVGQTDSDTLSSKFEEYRDLPNGVVAPFFRFRGEKDGFHWDVAGRDVQERDQRYWLTLSKGVVSVK